MDDAIDTHRKVITQPQTLADALAVVGQEKRGVREMRAYHNKSYYPLKPEQTRPRIGPHLGLYTENFRRRVQY